MDEYVPCSAVFKIIGVDTTILKLAITLYILMYTLMNSSMKRKKISTRIKLRNITNYDRERLNDGLKMHCMSAIFAISCSIVANRILITLFFYFAFEAGYNSYYEAILCNVTTGLAITYLSAGQQSMVHIFIFVVTIIKTGFLSLSKELLLINKNGRNLFYQIESLILCHDQLWLFINHTNKVYGVTFLVNYFVLMFLTCLFIYNLLFIKMHTIATLLFLFNTAVLGGACLIVAFLLSGFVAAMQNGFQDIRKFANCRLELEEKLKVLNFMKRFGKASLSISMEDFFNITKKFPIKMANSLYSIYSSLLNLRSIQERCTKKTMPQSLGYPAIIMGYINQWTKNNVLNSYMQFSCGSAVFYIT
ncbi:uncharacterized protein LOC111637050 [Centruroides sculpturatus]|uniref:uncharacterized protein LOC111637050 n=1 Tax=Centruroides sculpturatus TaxID=218467 RepID=UPI000C6CDDC8|nr:uncharacterized protein LOC111637050 [Centruroides sculpturatus]